MAGSPKYFAAAAPEEIGSKLFSKIDELQAWASSSPIVERADRAYRYYFGEDYSGEHATSQVLRGGDQGELSAIRVNHSRALAQTLFNLIAAAKVSWQAVATNSDFSAASQAVRANGVLEYYWHDGLVAKNCQQSLEEAIPLCEGFLLTEWDETLGEPVAFDAETSQLVKTGDIRFTNLSTGDVLRDPRKRSYDELDWVFVRLRRNRFNLAAQYPEMAEEILNATTDPAKSRNPRSFDAATQSVESEDIDAWLFLHKPTAAMPFGRETLLVSAKGVLRDGPLSYTFWPLHRVHHSEFFGTPFAYSPYLEILGVQELMDSLETVLASNLSTFAGQLIAMEQGSEVDVEKLSGGFKAIYIPPGGSEPKPLQLCRSPQEAFPYLETKKKDQEQIMGLNAVVRGEPLTGDQSGAALALLQATAVQQSSGLQANYLRFVQGVGNAIIELIKTRCPEPRRIAIGGKANKFLQKEESISGKSIGQIKKVMVEIGNPMAQTAAGRVSMAKELLANQLIKTPEQYLQVIETGRLEPLTQSVNNELLLILKENEQILKGEVPIISADDDHLLHAREHRGVIANPDARLDPKITAAYQAHIQEHQDLYYGADPARLMLMGQQPPMMPAGPPPGAPPGPEGAAGAPLSPAAPPEAELPNMPTNPATGEPAPIPDGASLAQPGQAPGPRGAPAAP